MVEYTSNTTVADWIDRHYKADRMAETTKSERLAWLKEVENTRSQFTYDEREGIAKLVRDADHLAQIERQVTYRTVDMPEWAVGWTKYHDSGCSWKGARGQIRPAPDLRPDEPGPLWLPIINSPNWEGCGRHATDPLK